MREQTITANGIQFFVMTAGDPKHPAILLLHGFPETSSQWRKQITFLSEQGYFVVAPNQRGYHGTSKPARVRDYHIDTLAHDAVSLMETLGHREFFLVGHDWGGFVAWQVAFRFPNRVKKLVVLNASLMRVYERMLLTFRPKQLLKSWYVFMFQVPWLPTFLMRLGFGKFIFKSYGRSDMPMTDEEYVQYYKAWFEDNAMPSMLAWYRSAVRTSLGTFYGQLLRLKNPYKKLALPTEKIKPPTLVLWGDGDVYLTTALAERSVALCENGRVEYFAGVSHWITHEIPDTVNERIATFFAQA
jgi:epoxide hydrolase 4